MKNQPFLLPVAGLVSGILFSEYASVMGNGLWLVVLAFLTALFLIFRKNRFSALILSLFSVCGFLFHNNHNKFIPLNQDLTGEKHIINLKIDETFRSSDKYRKYSAKILSVDSLQIENTKALLYVGKNIPDLHLNQEIWIYAGLQELQKPLNPYQFDYSKYLRRKGIHYTIFQNDTIVKLKQPSGFYYDVSVFKKSVYEKMAQNGYSKATIDLTGAMFLGDRTEMDPDIENDFRRSGVVHLLAISGLHVMMVFNIFMILLTPLEFVRNGKHFKIIISLLLIWLFVAFVDFKPPVFRSGLMISIYFISVLLKRKPNIYHTLLLSALILLLYNPNFLFDPGFLLSFSAVFFIVYLNPVFNRLFKPKNKLLKGVYSLTTTSVAAQTGTLPFSVFFFNQTSGLFLAGNIVMISASYLMVWGAFITVLLTVFGVNFEWWRWLFDFFINACYTYVHWLSSFDSLVFDRLSLTVGEVVLLFVGLLLLRTIYFKPKAQHLFVFLSLILIFEGQRIYRLNQVLKKAEIIVFHQHKATVIGVRKASLMDVYLSDLNDSVNVEKYIVRPYTIHQKIRKVNFRDLNTSGKGFYEKTGNFISLNNNRLILYSKPVDSLIRAGDFLLIRNNTQPDSVPKAIRLIVDGSNYAGFAERITQDSVWNTGIDGAKIIR